MTYHQWDGNVTNRIVPAQSLPASLLNDPVIRSAALSIFQKAPGVYEVPGRSSIYTVVVSNGIPYCTCIAAQHAQRCAHSIATLRHHERITMSKFTPSRSQETTFTAQQPVRLDQGIYGAMFRGYSEPKAYAKYQSTDTEEKVALRFLVTHAANEKPLERFSIASILATTKWFFDPIGRKQSRYFEFHAAILAGKHKPEDVYAMFDPSRDVDELPDLDDLMGYPIQLMLQPSPKPDKNGIYYNNIVAMIAASPGTRKAIGVIYKKADFTYDDQTGLRYMKSPKPEYEETSAPSNGNVNGHTPISDDDFDSTPF